MGWRNKSVLPVGYARVMADMPQSDGTLAYEIVNFGIDDRGLLDSSFKAMPLHPKNWGKTPIHPAVPVYPPELSKVYGLGFFDFGMSGRPELLFITDSGIRRFAPWHRTDNDSALIPVYFYDFDNNANEVIPTGTPRFPAQMESVGKYVYINFCDGGACWVWNGEKLRKFGYTNKPPPAIAQGPSSSANGATTSAERLAMLAGENCGGFSFPGRIGSLENDWTDNTGAVLGGLDQGLWEYYVVWENEAGAYSAMSPVSSPVTMHRELASTATMNLYRLTRSFWVGGIGTGPEGTVARIILRTPNLMRLGPNDDGRPRLLKRIPNNVSEEFIDDIPDGALGAPWEDREVLPRDFYFMKYFSGSLFLMRTDEEASRVWWSEQTNIFGPTPESFMMGHWMDVSPETGPITGAIAARFGSGDTASSMLVFKEHAVHAVGGQYPNFQSATIRKGPGLAGPNLVQSAPDGTVVFYGANTFWKLDPSEGQVNDIGGPIRKRLARINPFAAKRGVSWIQKKTGELYFALPLDDSKGNNIQFVYDYRYSGWRLREDFIIESVAAIPRHDIVLIAGTYDSLSTVWVKDRGYSSFSFTHPTAKYSSGWFSLGEGPSGFSSTYHLTDLIVTGEERGSTAATAHVYKEWDLSDVAAADSITAAHAEESPIAYYGSALWGVGTWRSDKFYQQRIGLDTHSTGVSRVEIQVSSPFCLYGMDVFGLTIASPSGRVPEGSSS